MSDWLGQCNNSGEQIVLGFLNFFKDDPDCAMAFDYVMDKKEGMGEEIAEAVELIRKHFGHKVRSVGARGELRDRIATILYPSLHNTKDVKSFLTSELGLCLMWTLRGTEANAPPIIARPDAWPITPAINQARMRLRVYIREQSARHRLREKVVRILSRNKGQK